MNLADLSAADTTAGYRSGQFSPLEVLEAVTRRMDEHEPTINAMWKVTIDEKAAETSAKRWKAGTPLSELDGVVVTVKENLARAGIPMTLGTAAGEPVIPQANSPVVDRLEEAGALIVGATVMPDWAMLSSGVSSRHGITRSPLNPALTTGGSSSGAGAAAAAGYGPIHIGTDIGGSVRLPGTWLGLATFKPSFGRVPLAAPYQGRCAGPLARRMSDVIAAMNIIGRGDARDYSALPGFEGAYGAGAGAVELDPTRLRVGVLAHAGCGMDVDPEVAAVVAHVADVCAEAGAQVEEVQPFMTQELLDNIDVCWRVRSYNDYAALDAEEQAKVLPYIARWVEPAARVSGSELMAAYNSIHTMRRRTVAATQPYDIVLSPVAPVAAFAAELPMPYNDPTQSMGHISFTVPYNMSEQPAATVNGGYTSDGRAVGVQVAGRRFADAQVLSVAQWLEAVVG